MPEPSVLDYIIAKLMPWRKSPYEFPEGEEPVYHPQVQVFAAPEPQVRSFPWRSMLALGLALAAQRSLEPRPDRTWVIGAVLYGLAALFLVWAYLRREWQAAEPPPPSDRMDSLIVQPTALLSGALLMVLAFFLFTRLGPDSRQAPVQFNDLNVTVWFAGIAFLVAGFWVTGRGGLTVRARLDEWLAQPRWEPLVIPALLALVALAMGNLFGLQGAGFLTALILFAVAALWLGGDAQVAHIRRLRAALNQPRWGISFSPWLLVLLAVASLAAFFRLYRLSDVPPQMVSDHAEKLMDVYDVVKGQLYIYFPRNTGREFFQMYLTAAVIKLLDTGFSFLSLKIGTALGGLLTLPYIYLAGKELGGKRLGLFAAAFAGIAYWPNLIARIALRFTLYPLFFAPVLFHLLRGLRTSNRNDFILAGVFLGLGLHGYSPSRMVPLVVVAAIVLYMLHNASKERRWQALWWLGITAFVSLAVFIPLLAYAFDNPGMFAYRALTRLSGAERSIPGDPLVIFLSNLWNALTMFAWDNGEVWVISLTHRPVLDWVTGALFHLGVVFVLVRYLRQRRWTDLFLLLSIPLLMLPSILSLAFPGENPSLNRTAAALVPVFLIVGMALEGLWATLKAHLGELGGRRLGWGLAVILLVLAALINYDMVFRRYQRVYELSSWNTSELGQVVRDFAGLYGSPDTAWLVAYPHWVDSRLVMFNAGYPYRDNALLPERISDTVIDPRAKLFLLNPYDNAALESLQELYPQGWATPYQSRYEGKDFMMFFVPPNAESTALPALSP